MTNVLYIGNNLIHQTANISAIGILGPKLEQEGYTVYYASSKPNKVLRILDMLYSVLRYTKRVDVVLIDTYSTQNFYFAFFVSQLCRVLGLPYIPILHGGNLPNRLKTTRKMSNMLFKPARYLVSPSIYLKTIFEEAGFKQVIYIPNSLSVQQYAFHEKTYETIRLLWVRSFSTIYNPQLAVKVLKALKDFGLEASLCMVGPDSDGTLKTLKQLAKDLNVSVRFTGKLPKKEWLILAKEYNLFINTTNFDNMPVSVIEAMALGLPVVSTNVGGLPYLIEHETDGLLVPPDNTEAFVEAIKHLINHPEVAKVLAVNARQKIKKFDWEVVKLRWIEVLVS